MRKWYKRVIALAMTLCLSVALPNTSFADYDSKSGLEDRYPNKYVNSDGQVVLQSEGWKQTQPFFAGYAIVCTSKQAVQKGESWIFDYAIIDESGTTISIFNFQGSYLLITKEFKRFVENPDGYVWWLSNQNSNGLYYITGKVDGTLNSVLLTDLCPQIEGDREITYSVGSFRDGSANIYEVNGPKETDIFENEYYKRAIGSITIEGTFSTSINKKSKYGREVIPAYGTKQFAENKVTGGWREDETGWWYDNGDGTYPVNQWKEIEGKYYYFGEDGYMLKDCYTPDGYSLDFDGSWIEEIPQMTDEKFNELYKNELINLYTTGIFANQEIFREAAREFFEDPAYAEQVIQEIESNYTFVPAQ